MLGWMRHAGKAGAEAQAAVAPSVVQLRAQLEQLAGQMQGVSRARLGSAHPDVQSLSSAISPMGSGR